MFSKQDIRTVFLQSEMEEDIYVKQAPGYEVTDGSTGEQNDLEAQAQFIRIAPGPAKLQHDI